jgi:hypothetical protein
MALVSEAHSGGRVFDVDGRLVVNAQDGIDNTLGQGQTAAAPGASATLAAVTIVDAGVYRVDVTIALTATAETALMNLRLRQSGTILVTPLPSLSGLVIQLRFPRVPVIAGALFLQTIAAAAAGSIYNTVISATRIA